MFMTFNETEKRYSTIEREATAIQQKHEDEEELRGSGKKKS